MRVLLIQPPSSISYIDHVFMHEPLALEYLGAGLKWDGHQVVLHDCRIDPEVMATVVNFRPEIVGLTSYTNQVNIVKKLASQLQQLSWAPLVVVGGHHATVQSKDFNIPAIDVVVIGEGVTTLQEIAREMADQQDYTNISGLAIPGTPMHFTPARPHPALDDLPLPDRTLTAAYRHHYFSEWLRPLASVRTSLGCVGRCNFCALWALTGSRYLKRDPELVVEELHGISEKNIFFCDDESMCDVQRMQRLAELIATSGIQKNYFLYARADTIVRHPQLFARWREIGLQQVFVGMESYSDTHLQAMHKGVTVAQQEEAVRILHRLDILLYASFVVDAGFSRGDFRALTAYVRRLRLQYASFSVLTPLPGTEMYRQRQHDLLSNRPELFDFLHTVLPTRLPLAEFYREFSRLWQTAIPWYRAIRTLLRYGYKRLPGVLRLLRQATAAMRRAPLDHAE